jgi:hypothetical protein
MEYTHQFVPPTANSQRSGRKMDGRMREFLFNDVFLVQFVLQVLLLVTAHALAVYAISGDSPPGPVASTHFWSPP